MGISSVESLSYVQLFETPWITAHQASLSITNSWSLPKLMSPKSEMPSRHLILWRSLLFLPPIPLSIRVFSSESTLRMKWPKYWSFSFSISPSNENPGLISLRMGLIGSLCSPRDSQESSPTPQFKSINSLALSFLHSSTLTSVHDHRKNHSLGYIDLCWHNSPQILQSGLFIFISNYINGWERAYKEKRIWYQRPIFPKRPNSFWIIFT